MDAIWAVAVGTQLGGTQSQIKFMARKEAVPLPLSQESLVEFAEASLHLQPCRTAWYLASEVRHL